VMEPLLGGKLANPPAEVRALYDQYEHKRTPVEWALQWLWNKPEVSIALSGMSNMEQTEQNLEYAKRSGCDNLSDSELALIAQVVDKYNELCLVPCTACKYCMPCPHGVDIPGNFSIFNDGSMYNVLENSRNRYKGLDQDKRASKCVACRECESKCPQSIPISEWMPLVHAVLGEGEAYSCVPDSMR